MTSADTPCAQQEAASQGIPGQEIWGLPRLGEIRPRKESARVRHPKSPDSNFAPWGVHRAGAKRFVARLRLGSLMLDHVLDPVLQRQDLSGDLSQQVLVGIILVGRLGVFQAQAEKKSDRSRRSQGAQGGMRLGIHYRGVQWEGGAADGGSIM